MDMKRKEIMRGSPGKAKNALSGMSLVYIGLMLFIILAVTTMRIHVLDVPLERDEGEYAYFGQLLLQGIPPYKEAYNMKLPGTYLAYAVIMAIFGQSPSGIHLGLLIVNFISLAFVYLIAREFFGVPCSATAVASYAILSISPSVLGLFAHATHFILVCALPGVWLLIRAAKQRKEWMYLASGIFLGCGVLMKQPGLLLVVFGGSFVVMEEMRRTPFSWKTCLRSFGFFATGATLPYALTCVTLWLSGVFDTFWFWTVTYATEYGSMLSLHDGVVWLRRATRSIFSANPALWLLSLAGIILLLITPQKPRARVFVIGFLVFSFLAVCPGLYFRPHYFVVLLPAASLCIGIAVEQVADRVERATKRELYGCLAGLVLFVVACYNGIVPQGRLLLTVTPEHLSRMLYGASPFVESLKVAEYIKENSAKDDRIAILGSEPQIYFYAHRRSASGYIYVYGLMETHAYAVKMQEDMIKEIEKAAPKYVLVVDVYTSWNMRPQSEKYIVSWAERYLSTYYDLVMYAAIDFPQTRYYFDEEARSFDARNRKRPETLKLFKRKE